MLTLFSRNKRYVLKLLYKCKVYKEIVGLDNNPEQISNGSAGVPNDETRRSELKVAKISRT